MGPTVTDITPDTSRISSFHAGLTGPLANDMPYTPYTRATLDRLAALAPRTLAAMHGASFRGDGTAAVRGLAAAIDELLGRPRAAS